MICFTLRFFPFIRAVPLECFIFPFTGPKFSGLRFLIALIISPPLDILVVENVQGNLSRRLYSLLFGQDPRFFYKHRIRENEASDHYLQSELASDVHRAHYKSIKK